MIEAALRDLYLSKVRLYKVLRTDKYGVDVYDTVPEELPCRLEGSTQEIITPTGTKTAATGRALLIDAYPWLNEKCNMYVQNLSGGWDWVELLNVDTVWDERGPYYQALYYGQK